MRELYPKRRRLNIADLTYADYLLQNEQRAIANRGKLPHIPAGIKLSIRKTGEARVLGITGLAKIEDFSKYLNGWTIINGEFVEPGSQSQTQSGSPREPQ